MNMSETLNDLYMEGQLQAAKYEISERQMWRQGLTRISRQAVCLSLQLLRTGNSACTEFLVPIRAPHSCSRRPQRALHGSPDQEEACR